MKSLTGDSKCKFLVVFFLINLFLCSFYIDTWINANTTSRALPVITFFESGTFRIDKYHEKTCDKAFVSGHYYTDKAPLPTFIVLPVFGFMKSLGLIRPDENGSLFGKHVYILGGILTAVLPFSLLILWLFKRIENAGSALSPVLLATLPFYSSFIFLFAGTFFAHILSGLFLIGSYIYLKKEKFIISGFFAGLSFLCEYNLALIFAIWGIQILVRARNFKPAVLYSAGVLPSVLFILVYNSIFSDSPLTMLYKFHNFGETHSNYGFHYPTFRSLWGLSFSGYKGLLFYSPFLILVIVLFFRKLKYTDIKNLLTHPMIISSILYFLFIASYFGWWGGWTQGPRLLLALAMLLTFAGVQFIADKKFHVLWFWLLTGAGLVITMMSKITVLYSVPTNIANPMIDLVIPEWIKGNFNENNIMTIIFGTGPISSAIIFGMTFIGGISLLHVWHGRLTRPRHAQVNL